jgi:hypothetical protein
MTTYSSVHAPIGHELVMEAKPYGDAVCLYIADTKDPKGARDPILYAVHEVTLHTGSAELAKNLCDAINAAQQHHTTSKVEVLQPVASKPLEVRQGP